MLKWEHEIVLSRDVMVIVDVAKHEMKLIISFLMQLAIDGVCGSGCAPVTEYERGRAVDNQYEHTLSQEKARERGITNKQSLESG